MHFLKEMYLVTCPNHFSIGSRTNIFFFGCTFCICTSVIKFVCSWSSKDSQRKWRQTLKNSFLQSCCFPGDGKEMYQNVKRTRHCFLLLYLLFCAAIAAVVASDWIVIVREKCLSLRRFFLFVSFLFYCLTLSFYFNKYSVCSDFYIKNMLLISQACQD